VSVDFDAYIELFDSESSPYDSEIGDYAFKRYKKHSFNYYKDYEISEMLINDDKDIELVIDDYDF
jgi:hypothetical protein